MFPLRQSTASQEIPLGPFVDSADGNTAETGLTIANTDIKLWKSGATSEANKNSGGATHMASGRYYAVLDATDTDTLGPLKIVVHVAGALYVQLQCIVLPAVVYDALIAGSDNLQVDAVQLNGTNLTARDIGASVLLSSGTGAGQISLASGAVTVGTNNDKTGYGLSSAAVQAIWDAATSALTTAGSIGKLLVDNINATISSRLASASYTAPPSAATIAAAVWDYLVSAATTVGSLGKLLGDNVNATISSRSSHSAADVWSVGTRTLTGFGTLVQDIWDKATSALTTGGSIGKLLVDNIDAAISSRSTYAGADTAGTTTLLSRLTVGRATNLDNLDATVSSRASAADLATVAGYLDTEIAAILADTNELQTDWANGGRLDNILDSRASQASVDAVDDLLDTEVVAIMTVTDKLNDTLEDDGGTYRFTANALEQAPTGGSAPTAAQIADAVWDEAITDHLTAGSTGAALNAAGSAGDPWSTPLPGAYGAGTAGKIVGDNLNATVSSRSSHSAADVWAVATRALTDKAGFSLSSAGIQAIWDAATSALTTVGSIGKLLVDRIDAAISSRMATFTYTAPDNTGIAAIQAKTDNLPSDPADASDVAALIGALPTAVEVRQEMDSNSTKLANLDAAVSTRSSHSAADVWAVGTRTLTGFGTLVADIWAAVTDSAGVTTLLSRLTATRAGNLDNLDATVSSRLASASYTAPPSAASIASAVWATVVEGSYTAVQLMRGYASALLGANSGMATATGTFKGVDGTTDRIVASQDGNGNRTSVTLDLN